MAKCQIKFFRADGTEYATYDGEAITVEYSNFIHFARHAFQHGEDKDLHKGFWKDVEDYIGKSIDHDGYITIQEITQEAGFADGPITLIPHLVGTTFNQIRKYNTVRLPFFKNKFGFPAHAKEDGSDWTFADWITTIGGEFGELCGWHKKVLRKEIDLRTFRDEAGKELADIVHYCDLTAFQFGVDLGLAVRNKYNEVSHRIDLPQFIIPII